VKTAALSTILLALLAGCSLPKHERYGTGDLLLAASLQRAIVVQSTLFPYHFVPDSAQLNELGQRDLLVLARHFQAHAGTLAVRGGDAPAPLAEARLRAVIEALTAAGVARDHVVVRDGLPSGDGLASAHVIEVMKGSLVLSGAGVSTVISTATATSAQSSAAAVQP
jgi:hypothetical protein